MAASARVNPYERGKHMPHLQTVAQLAKVVNVPVPYFYCQDAELAEILKFSALGKAEKAIACSHGQVNMDSAAGVCRSGACAGAPLP